MADEVREPPVDAEEALVEPEEDCGHPSCSGSRLEQQAVAARGMFWWLGWIFLLPVRFYQMFVSPLLPPVCRFEPSCSNYFVRAVQKHGVFKGSALGVWRILRCQPFSKGGYDPVP